MPVFSLTSRRRATLAALAERVLEAPDLTGLTRLLTVDLRQALAAESASLLLWDRRLESFESLELDESSRLRRQRPAGASPASPRTRFLLSEGQLVETSPDAANEMLVPLLARSGLAGMLVLGPVEQRRRPVTRRRRAARLARSPRRAALAFENLAYQKELIETERLAALGTMAGMLVHDFRGPMTLIRGWAETLVEGERRARRRSQTRAQAIVDAVDRLERMTGETLDFVRGAEKLVLRSVPLGVLVAELAAGIEAELPGLTVERDFDLPGGRRGPVDVDKIRRAVSNIAANARDAMGGSGRLALSARVEPLAGPDGPREHLVLVLADEGPGIAPEHPRARLRALRDPRQEARHRPGPRRGAALRGGPRRPPRARGRRRPRAARGALPDLAPARRSRRAATLESRHGWRARDGRAGARARALASPPASSHDAARELELSGLETYWIVDSPRQGQNYIAPVVRFRLKNVSAEPLALGPGPREVPRGRPGGGVGLDPGAGEHLEPARSSPARTRS